MAIPFYLKDALKLNRRRLAYATKIIATEINQHDMLSPLLLVLKQVLFMATILLVVFSSGTRSRQRSRDDTVMLIAAPGTEAFVQEFTETALGDPKDEGYTLGDPLDKGNASAGYELMRGHLAGYLGAMKLAAAGGG